MNRRSPRATVATALASQIDCSTFIGSASDGVVATSASAAALSATGASTASFDDACCAPSPSSIESCAGTEEALSAKALSLASTA